MPAAAGRNPFLAPFKQRDWFLKDFNNSLTLSFRFIKLNLNKTAFYQISVPPKRLVKSPRMDGNTHRPKWALLFVHGHLAFWLSDPCGPLILWLSRTESGFFWSQLWNSQGLGPLLLKNNHHCWVRGSWHKKKEQVSYFQSLGDVKIKT